MNFITILFFVLVYFNQGISSLPAQCEYYLLYEHWGLSMTMLGVIGMIASIPWYIKPLWGFLVDHVPIKNYRSKYYLFGSYIMMLLCYLFIVLFGLNVWTIIITGFIINCCIGICDVANDTQMVILEQKNNLKGKLQSIQWSSLAIAGLFVSLGGAFIADKFAIDVGYRIAYAIAGIIPITTIIYLKKYYKEEPVQKTETKFNFKEQFKIFKNKQLLLSLAFLACYQLCPSFGNALMAKVRELGAGKMFLGYVSATGTVLGLVGYGLYYWKAHKFKMRSLMIFMIIFSAITNLFYLYIPDPKILILYNVLFGAFSGITFLTLLRFFTTLIPKGSEGMTYAIITSISNFCGKGGSLLGGIIYDHSNYETTVIVSTLLTLVCLFFIPKLKFEGE